MISAVSVLSARLASLVCRSLRSVRNCGADPVKSHSPIWHLPLTSRIPSIEVDAHHKCFINVAHGIAIIAIFRVSDIFTSMHRNRQHNRLPEICSPFYNATDSPISLILSLPFPFILPPPIHSSFLLLSLLIHLLPLSPLLYVFLSRCTSPSIPLSMFACHKHA
uniref:Secreted protein n=1 Tax=Ascaris lumbricoides TaxID=6252 RepID=A0A0M3HN32_ASCLU